MGYPLESESESSDEEAVGAYFVMEHTVDSDEVAVGVDEEKPLSVGDSFFDIDDEELAKDLAAKFGLKDEEPPKEESIQTKSSDSQSEKPLGSRVREVMIGV